MLAYQLTMHESLVQLLHILHSLRTNAFLLVPNIIHDGIKTKVGISQKKILLKPCPGVHCVGQSCCLPKNPAMRHAACYPNGSPEWARPFILEFKVKLCEYQEQGIQAFLPCLQAFHHALQLSMN